MKARFSRFLRRRSKKRTLLLVVVLLFVFASCQERPVPGPPVDLENAPATNPMVHQDGTYIVDGAGNAIQLRGVNLSGWLFWEGWVWGGGFTAEQAMLQRLEQLVGAEATAQFQKDVYNNFITENDIARIASMDMNVVRVLFNHTVLEDDSAPFVYKQSGWDILDRLLDWCDKHDVYVVLALTSAPGGQSRWFVADPDKTKLWDSEENKNRTVALWQAIANRYHDREIIAGYDLLNEPAPPNGKALVELYQRIVRAIREVDRYHMVIIEGTSASRKFSIFGGPISINQAYSFHMYTWFAWFGDPRQKELDRYRNVSEQHNVPMWNGEFGENNLELLQSTIQMFEDPRNKVRGWAFLPWKKLPYRGSKYPSLIEVNTSDQWKKVIEWIKSPSRAQPSREEALAGMNEFLYAIRLENNDTDSQMVELLQSRADE